MIFRSRKKVAHRVNLEACVTMRSNDIGLKKQLSFLVMEKRCSLPWAFIWRRLQSLMGLFIVFFLFEHLFTNSQAALLIGDDGSGFVRAVNFIHNFPYLPVIELTLLGVPFAIHIVWGLHYLFTSKQNAYGGGAERPRLTYRRNRAYTWQRLTSWILVVGIIVHVVQMRFLNYPTSGKLGATPYYAMGVTLDPGIATVAQRLGVTLYNADEVARERQLLLPPHETRKASAFTGDLITAIEGLFTHNETERAAPINALVSQQRQKQEREWVAALDAWPLAAGHAVAVADNFGTAELMMVRDAFKSPWNIAWYSLFVLAACYHGFNGLWTFCITWGLTLSDRSQRKMRLVTSTLMALVTAMGLAAIWGTFWINLKR